jgi:hypothetical protein
MFLCDEGSNGVLSYFRLISVFLRNSSAVLGVFWFEMS